MYVFPSTKPTPTDRITRGRYTVSVLNDAVKAVIKDTMSCYQAAQIYKIPRSTIQRRVANIKEEHRRARQSNPSVGYSSAKNYGSYSCSKPYRYKNTDCDLKTAPARLVRDIRRANMLKPLLEPERYRKNSYNISSHHESPPIEYCTDEYQTHDEEQEYYMEDQLDDDQDLIYIKHENGSLQRVTGLNPRTRIQSQLPYTNEEVIEYGDETGYQQSFYDSADEVVVIVDDGMDVAQECEVATETEEEIPPEPYIFADGSEDHEQLLQKPCSSNSYSHMPSLSAYRPANFNLLPESSYSSYNRMPSVPVHQMNNMVEKPSFLRDEKPSFLRDEKPSFLRDEKPSFLRDEKPLKRAISQSPRSPQPPKKIYRVIRVIGPPPPSSLTSYTSPPPSLDCEEHLLTSPSQQEIDVD